MKKDFNKFCQEKLPTHIEVDNVKHILFTGDFGNTLSVCYPSFNKHGVINWNFENRLVDSHYQLVDVIPAPKPTKKSEIVDSTIYVLSFDDIISDVLSKLKKLNYKEIFGRYLEPKPNTEYYYKLDMVWEM